MLKLKPISDEELKDEEVLFFFCGYINGLKEEKISPAIFKKLKIILKKLKGGGEHEISD